MTKIDQDELNRHNELAVIDDIVDTRLHCGAVKVKLHCDRQDLELHYGSSCLELHYVGSGTVLDRY